MDLATPLRNFFFFLLRPEPVREVASEVVPEPKRKDRFPLRLDEAAKRTLDFARRNGAFRTSCVSHWNPYGGGVRRFAGLFVFNGLSSFSFRRPHGVSAFNNLPPISFRRAISGRSAGPRAAMSAEGGSRNPVLAPDVRTAVSLQQKRYRCLSHSSRNCRETEELRAKDHAFPAGCSHFLIYHFIPFQMRNWETRLDKPGPELVGWATEPLLLHRLRAVEPDGPSRPQPAPWLFSPASLFCSCRTGRERLGFVRDLF